MSKQEFLAKLRNGLTGIPHNDIEEWITFYSEMIDDRMEDGLTEEGAVAELGSAEGIIAQIMSEISLAKLVREKVKPNRALRVWEIVLLVLGSPIWLALGIALFAVMIAVYAVIWSLIISLWAVELSIAVGSAASLVSFAVFAVQGNISSAAAMLGAGFVCAGLAIFGCFGCTGSVRAIRALTKRIFVWIKSCFIKRETAK